MIPSGFRLLRHNFSHPLTVSGDHLSGHWIINAVPTRLLSPPSCARSTVPLLHWTGRALILRVAGCWLQLEFRRHPPRLALPTLFERQSPTQNPEICCCSVTRFSLSCSELLHACIDFTHLSLLMNNKAWYQLYTFVVFVEQQSGVPVAWDVASKNTSEYIVLWLEQLMLRCYKICFDWKVDAFMVVDALAEMTALRDADERLSMIFLKQIKRPIMLLSHTIVTWGQISYLIEGTDVHARWIGCCTCS